MSGPLERNGVSGTPETFADEVDRQLAARVGSAIPRNEEPTPELGEWTCEIVDPDAHDPGPFIPAEVHQVVETALRAEVPAVQSAAERLLGTLGSVAFRERVVRRVVGSRVALSAGLLPGRAHELVVDGSLVVWRGEWIADGESTGWHSRWLVEPDGIVDDTVDRPRIPTR